MNLTGANDENNQMFQNFRSSEMSMFGTNLSFFFSIMQMLFYGIALRLYGFIVVHLFGLWLLVQQVVSFCNGDPPKKFNFVRQEQKVNSE